MDKVVITGATGFVGENFVKENYQKFDIYPIVRKSSNVRNLLNYIPERKIIYTDDFYKKNDFTDSTLLHLASYVTPDNSQRDLLYLSNVEFGKEVVKFFIENSGRKILNIGTYWECYENRIDNANTYYAQTKIDFKNYLANLSPDLGLKILNLKLFDTYGAGDRRRKIFNIIRDVSNSGDELEISSGEQWINFTHIDDVIRGLCIAKDLLSIQSSTVRSYFLKDDTHTTKLKDAINLFLELKKINPKLIWGARAHSKCDFFHKLNCYENLPGFHQNISLEQGLKESF